MEYIYFSKGDYHMGRGGGSHGGGGHSGGRSFGGRSGGGFGGGGRRSGSGFGGPGFGGPGFGGPGFGGMPPGRPPRRHFGFGPIFPGPRRWGGPRRGGGCSVTILVFIILLCIFGFLVQNSSTRQDPEITVSRTERTAVTGTVTSRDWYLDELGYIRHDTDLTDGLKYFYSKTGIQPYVMLLDYDPSLWPDGQWSENAAEEYLAKVYSDTFSDNGHLIFAYFACENDTEDMDGTFCFYYGSAAFSIMDNEAETIFWSYFDRNYNNLDLSIAEFLGQTFRETADNIMHTGSGTPSLMQVIVIFSIVCIIVIIAAVIVVRNLRSKKEF